MCFSFVSPNFLFRICELCVGSLADLSCAVNSSLISTFLSWVLYRSSPIVSAFYWVLIGAARVSLFIFLGSSVYFVRTPSLSSKASFPLMFSSFASDLSLLSIEFIFVGNFRSYLYCLVYVSRLVILSFF